MTPAQRKAKIKKCKGELNAIHKHYLAKRAEIEALVKECPHENQKRYSDPSGGSDHAYECLDCGKSW